MKYSFKRLWNTTFLFVGPAWYVLVWMIWSSGQLQSISDKMTFLGTIISQRAVQFARDPV